MSGHQKTEISAIAAQKEITNRKANYAHCIELNKMHQKAANVSLYRRMHLESEEEEMLKNIQKVCDLLKTNKRLKYRFIFLG